MTQTDRQTVHAQAAFDRRGVLDDVKARLSAISGTLSDSRIDVGQLRKDVAELTASPDASRGWLTSAHLEGLGDRDAEAVANTAGKTWSIC